MRLSNLSATLLATACTMPLAAMDSHIVGPRALGLGGAGTAAADDHNASYYNPGMYGFFNRTGEEDAKLEADPNYVGRREWGIGFADATVGVEVRGRLADYVEQIADTDFDKLQDLGSASSSPEDLKAAMATAALLQTFSAKTDNAVVMANVGVLNTRILHVGIGVRQFAEGIVSVADLDTTNLGFGYSVADLDTAITTTSTVPGGYTNQLITPGSAAETALAGLSLSAAAISALDLAAVQAGLTPAQVNEILTNGGVLIDALTDANGGTDINDNQTAVLTGGYTVAEIPLTIGVALNDHISVGGNLKLMIGKVAAAKARLINGVDQLGDLMQDSFEEAEQTVTGAVDLGIVARCSWAQVGLTGRNLNSPVLKGGSFKDADGQDFTVDDITLDPQLSLGVALYPFETVVLTADIDVLENQTTYTTTSQRTGPLMAGIDPKLSITYKTQRVGGGLEWNVARFLALRGGYSTDLAESEAGGMIHAGLGLNLWLLRFDVAGAMATETVIVDGEEMPRAAAVSAGLTMDF
jgi:hypothetical protein